MAVLKVIEVLSSSSKSWEDAAEKAVAEASKTLRGIKSINITNQSCVVDNGKVVEYRINAKMSFEIEH